MGKHNQYAGKSDSDIQNLRVDEDKVKEQLKRNATKSWLEMDRKLFIEHLLKLSDNIDLQLKNKIENANDCNLARSKNILQSLVYLILNPIFYREVEKIRKKLKIPRYGFETPSGYKKWAAEYTRKYDLNFKESELKYTILKKSEVKQGKNILCSYGYDSVFREAEWLVKSHKIANKRDVDVLAGIIASFISRRLKFNSFLNRIAAAIYGNPNSYFAKGFEVQVKEMPLSKKDFYKYQWVVKLYPFCNKTNIGNFIKNFFEKEFIYEKNVGSYDEKFVKLQMQELCIDKKEWKQRPIVEMKDGKSAVALKFTTDFFTKPSQITKLYNEKSAYLKYKLEEKEEKLKKSQKKYLGKNFRRNYSIYKEYQIARKSNSQSLEGIYEEFYKSDELSFADEEKCRNVIKGELGEFSAAIRDAIKRKIIF